MVGETGPEFVQGPAIVTSASTTRDRMRDQRGDGVNVTIQNYGAPVKAEASRDENGNIMVKLMPILAAHKQEIKEELAADIHRGGGDMSGAFENAYGLTRGNQR
jgi:hypothetical protein